MVLHLWDEVATEYRTSPGITSTLAQTYLLVI
jgi:hypothetical protein